jgi:hypothetical protein
MLFLTVPGFSYFFFSFRTEAVEFLVLFNVTNICIRWDVLVEAAVVTTADYLGKHEALTA